MGSIRQSALDALSFCLDTKLFQAIAEPARLKILQLVLRDGPIDVTGIAHQMDVDRSVVSRHLKVLQEAGILRCEKQGRSRVYSFSGGDVVAKFEQLREGFRRAVIECCPQELGCCPPAGKSSKKKQGQGSKA